MTDLINGRTPEEIKRILSWINFDCSEHECDSCPNEDICSLQNGNESVLAKNALDLIQYLEAKQPKWISVKERLPVKQLRVIVQTGHGLVTTGWRSYHVDVRGGELWEVDGAHNYHNDVTHWMPTPEPKENE